MRNIVDGGGGEFYFKFNPIKFALDWPFNRNLIELYSPKLKVSIVEPDKGGSRVKNVLVYGRLAGVAVFKFLLLVSSNDAYRRSRGRRRHYK